MTNPLMHRDPSDLIKVDGAVLLTLTLVDANSSQLAYVTLQATCLLLSQKARKELPTGVVNKGVGLCDEAVPVWVRSKNGWESKDSSPFVRLPMKVLYIEEYMCGTTPLCMLQLTHDHFRAS